MRRLHHAAWLSSLIHRAIDLYGADSCARVRDVYLAALAWGRIDLAIAEDYPPWPTDPTRRIGPRPQGHWRSRARPYDSTRRHTKR